MAGAMKSQEPDNRLAVVGLGVHTAQFPDLNAYAAGIYSARNQSPPALPSPPGLHPEELRLLGLSLQDVERLDCESTLLLKVTASAISSSQALVPSAPSAPPAARSAVIYVRSSELVWSALQRFTGQESLPDSQVEPNSIVAACFEHLGSAPINVSLAGNPLAASLKNAQNLLESGSVDQVIIAAAVDRKDLDPLLPLTTLSLHSGPPQLGLDAAVDGWTFGHGAAAVCLMRAGQARARNTKIHALITGSALSANELASPRKHIVPTLVSADTIVESCRSALQAAAVPPADIGYLEALASGNPPLDAAEISGLCRAYNGGTPDTTCALGSALALDGYLLAASGVLALVRASLCLSARIIPPVPAWTGPKRPALFNASPFYIATEPRAWFIPTTQMRRAALNSVGWDGSCFHLILSESQSDSGILSLPLVPSTAFLFPIAAHSASDLLTRLAQLKQTSASGLPLPTTSLQAYRVYAQVEQPQQVACLVAQDLPELHKEIEFALRDIPSALDRGSPWQTPAGSYFTPLPVGPEANVAFMYPGAFNSYVGLGRDLFPLFPRLYDYTQNLTADPGLTIQERLLYPRGQLPLNKEQLKEVENRLNADPIAMITSGSLIAVLYTIILRDIFKVKPDAALGYSLGEIGMLFAMGIWDQADAVSAALKASPLFQQQLSGPKLAVRSHWSLPLEADQSVPVWENYFLMAPVDKVQSALANEKKVYLTHINTPRQVVIGGDPAACARVIGALKCTSLKAPFDFTLHCAAMRSAYPELVSLLTWPVANRPGAQLYTAAGFTPLLLDQRFIAKKISTMLCSPLDFPSLVRQVYDRGVRVFIELGANANCTKWVEECLKGEPALAVAVNRKGVDDHTSLVKLLARLVSHRVPLDLAPLYTH